MACEELHVSQAIKGLAAFTLVVGHVDVRYREESIGEIIFRESFSACRESVRLLRWKLLRLPCSVAHMRRTKGVRRHSPSSKLSCAIFLHQRTTRTWISSTRRGNTSTACGPGPDALSLEPAHGACGAEAPFPAVGVTGVVPVQPCSHPLIAHQLDMSTKWYLNHCIIGRAKPAATSTRPLGMGSREPDKSTRCSPWWWTCTLRRR